MKPNNIVQIFAMAEWGGGEQFVYELSKNLINNGYNVTTVSKKSDAVKSKIQDLESEHHYISSYGSIDILSGIKLYSIVKKNNVSIIHVHNFKDAYTAVYAKLLCKLFNHNVKVVMTRHLVREGKNSFFHKMLYKNLDKIIFVSECARKAFFSSSPQIDFAKTDVIKNCTPIYNLENSLEFDLREKFKIDCGDYIIIFSGRCVEEKGCDVLLKACGELNNTNFRLFFVGSFSSNEYKELLENIIKDYKLENKVVFLGFSNNVKGLLSQSDISVAPSICKEAGGNQTVIESMQTGCAIITSNNGAQPEYIDHNVSGILINPGDYKALAAELDRLLSNSVLQDNLGKAARKKYLENFTYDKLYNNYCKLYGSLS